MREVRKAARPGGTRIRVALLPILQMTRRGRTWGAAVPSRMPAPPRPQPGSSKLGGGGRGRQPHGGADVGRALKVQEMHVGLEEALTPWARYTRPAGGH